MNYLHFFSVLVFACMRISVYFLPQENRGQNEAKPIQQQVHTCMYNNPAKKNPLTNATPPPPISSQLDRVFLFMSVSYGPKCNIVRRDFVCSYVYIHGLIHWLRRQMTKPTLFKLLTYLGLPVKMSYCTVEKKVKAVV